MAGPGGSASQDRNLHENTNNYAIENSGQRNDPVELHTALQIASFTVTFPPPPYEELKEEDCMDQSPEDRCCICANRDRKLYIIPSKNRAKFQRLLDENNVPQLLRPLRVCWECNGSMCSYNTFRNRAVLTNSLLKSLISPYVSTRQQTTPTPEASGVRASPRHSAQANDNTTEDDGRPHRLPCCEPQER